MRRKSCPILSRLVGLCVPFNVSQTDHGCGTAMLLSHSLLTRLRCYADDDDDADTDRYCIIISIDRWYDDDGEMVEVKFFPTRFLGRKYEHGRRSIR